MWQRIGGMHRQKSATASRSGMNYKLWAILGVVALVGIMTFQIINTLTSPGPSTANPSATAVTDSGSSGFLSEGYNQLQNSDTASSSLSFWGLWSGIVIPLLIVIACVYIALRGLKYVNARVASSAASAKHLESLDTLSLSQSGAIHLVRIGSRVIAVGSSGQQLTLLTELDAPHAEEIISSHQEHAAQAAAHRQHLLEPFRDIVQKRLGTTSTPLETQDSVIDLLVPEQEPAAIRNPAMPEPAPIEISNPPQAETLEALLDRLRPSAATFQDTSLPVRDTPARMDVVSDLPARRD